MQHFMVPFWPDLSLNKGLQPQWDLLGTVKVEKLLLTALSRKIYRRILYDRDSVGLPGRKSFKDCI